MKTILSIFDHSGNWSKPYKEAGYNVIQIDIKLGIDILTWDYTKYENVVGILAGIPCTDYALSGARYFAAKDKDGRTEFSNLLVSKLKEVLLYYKIQGNLKFWSTENPMSRIHKLNTWLGEVKHKFNPCDYALYDPIPENSNYNKMTWLWGEFNTPVKQALTPITKASPIWTKYGGKSERTKELRSITPLGFAYAFFQANQP